jgi:hypothetical protein
MLYSSHLVHKTEVKSFKIYKQEPLCQISMQQGLEEGAEKSAIYQQKFSQCYRI